MAKPKAKQQTDEMTSPLAWQQVITEVVAGKRKSFEDRRIMMAVPDKVEKFITKVLGGELLQPESGGQLDTNGWQWDWWMHFQINGKAYTASGSGYYGGFGFGPREE